MQRAAQPPTAGAVDLGALKGAKEAAEEGKRQLLSQNGLLCVCGAIIEDEGVVLFSMGEGMVPTPNGPQPGVAMATQTFHSRECSALTTQLRAAHVPGQPKPIALRALPVTEWLEQAPSSDSRKIPAVIVDA
jgi:hypothetical protein